MAAFSLFKMRFLGAQNFYLIFPRLLPVGIRIRYATGIDKTSFAVISRYAARRPNVGSFRFTVLGIKPQIKKAKVCTEVRL